MKTIASTLAVWILVSAAAAEEDGEEMGFDEVVEEAVSHALGGWSERIHLSGRFDINLEAEDMGSDKGQRFRTYHNFVFLKADVSERLVLEAEIVDRTYYEIKYRFSEWLQLRGGRLWVPFGLTPFHHYYGGVQGDPFTGKLVPNVWAEQGLALSYSLYDAGAVVDGDTYAIRGFDANGGRVLQLNGGGSEGVLAYGQRLTLHLAGRKLSLAGSALYNGWGPSNDNSLLLWGVDVAADYGLIGLPLIEDLRLTGALAQARVNDKALAVAPDGDYTKYGDYVQLLYGRWRPGLTLRARLGSYDDFDHADSAKDTHSLNLALLRRAGPLTLMAEFFWNFEAVDEFDDDLLRLHAAVEF